MPHSHTATSRAPFLGARFYVARKRGWASRPFAAATDRAARTTARQMWGASTVVPLSPEPSHA